VQELCASSSSYSYSNEFSYADILKVEPHYVMVVTSFGKPKYSEKTCPSATLSTTNSTWLDPVLNPGRRGGKPATNRLSYGAALIQLLKESLF
jgi:hypothetical protein